MRFLLDTHFVIDLIDDVRYGLSEPGLFERAQEQGDLVVSVISLWEVEFKSRIGKLHLNRGVQSWPQLLAEASVELLAFSGEHVLADIQSVHDRVRIVGVQWYTASAHQRPCTDAREGGHAASERSGERW